MTLTRQSGSEWVSHRDGRVHTSGARAVDIHIDGALFVAVPQLAIDIPPDTDINGGDSDTSLMVFRAGQWGSPSINGSMHRW